MEETCISALIVGREVIMRERGETLILPVTITREKLKRQTK